MSKSILVLPDALAAQMLLAAARAYPRECCGLLEGKDTDAGWIITAVHETANVAENPSRHFLIDPQVQFDLMRALRGKDTRLVGCFHSHPDGVAAPSAMDSAEAYEPGFLYLIAGGAPDSGFVLRTYSFEGENGFAPVHLQEE